jgi:hypothetical protein
VRLLLLGTSEKGLEITRFERHILVVRHFAHDFAQHERLTVTVDGPNFLGRFGLPFGPIARRVCTLGFSFGTFTSTAHHTHFDDVEEQFSLVVANLCEFCVEIPRRYWG